MSGKVSSMTGFARVAGEAAWGSWAIEAKSVNGRSLDVRVNVPGGFEVLERLIKQAASKRFARGNMQVGLRIEFTGTAETLSVNHAALQQLLRAFEAAGADVLFAPSLPDLASIRAIRAAVSKPVNVLLGSAAAYSIEDLAATGIERVSLGARLTREAEGAAVAAARTFRQASLPRAGVPTAR